MLSIGTAPRTLSQSRGQVETAVVADANISLLKRHFPDDEAHQVSHETIYKSLFIQARGVLKKELVKHLRSRRLMRRSKLATSQPRGGIKGSISISKRPAEVADRAVPVHWEGDLISGAKNSHIATLVERHSRFTILVKVRGKDTESVVGALSRQVRRLPIQLRNHSRGIEEWKWPITRTLLWHRHGRVLLRPEKPVAARQQRKHQRAASAVLSRRHRPIDPLAGATQQGSKET
jgi:hypothetical protein